MEGKPLDCPMCDEAKKSRVSGVDYIPLRDILSGDAKRWINGPPVQAGDAVYCEPGRAHETFADRLEREMLETEERRFDKVCAYAASLGEYRRLQLEAAIAKQKDAKP